jgi:hypothetical protein
VPFHRVNPETPYTHQFQVWLAGSAETLNEAGVRQAEETKTAVFGKWYDSDLPGLALTEMTVAASALEWTAEDVASGVADFLSYVG